MPGREKLLFVCSQNRIRSLTAEKLLAHDQRYEVRSAGTEPDARIRVTAGHIGWKDSSIRGSVLRRQLLWGAGATCRDLPGRARAA